MVEGYYIDKAIKNLQVAFPYQRRNNYVEMSQMDVLGIAEFWREYINK